MRKLKSLIRNYLGGLVALGALSLALMPMMASASESSAELSIDVPTELGLTVSSGDQQCAGEAANSLCLDWANNMTAKGTQSVTVASNNATGYTLTVDDGDGKLRPTKSGVDDTISLEVSPESFRASVFGETKTHDFKYEARTSIVKSRVTAGDYLANVTYTVTANDAYGNTKADEKCDPASNPTACQYEFAYTGNVQKFAAPYSGKYKLEVWGASGGDARFTNQDVISKGGSGGYSVGSVDLPTGSTLYIQIGGAGGSSSFDTNSEVYSPDDNVGYNGGGVGHEYWTYSTPRQFNSIMGGGGGATSIATTDGLLSDHADSKQDVLIVAGAGSGAILHTSHPAWSADGGSGGGYVGGDGMALNNDSAHCYVRGFGATQGAPGRQENCARYGEGTKFSPSGFGYALNYTDTEGTKFNASGVIQNPAYSSGGAGWYGGGDGVHGPSGGGSGYLKSTLLDIGSSELKHMAGYDVKTSDDAATRTISVTCVKEKPTADCAKLGNGYARITYLGDN